MKEKIKNIWNKFKNFYKKKYENNKVLTIILTIIAVLVFGPLLAFLLVTVVTFVIGLVIVGIVFWIIWKLTFGSGSSKTTYSSNINTNVTTSKSSSDIESMAKENCEYLGLITSGIADTTAVMELALKSVHNISTNRKLSNKLEYENFGNMKFVYVPDKWKVCKTNGGFWNEKEDIFYYSEKVFPLNKEECEKRKIATYYDVRDGKVIIFHKGNMIRYKDIY